MRDQCLADAIDNGVYDDGEVYTLTDINGNYSFGNLATGMGALSTYRIGEVQQAGFQQVVPNAAGLPDPSVATYDTSVMDYVVTLTQPGQAATNINFFNQPVPKE